MTRSRLRMFAGPNGSGKSTIKNKIAAIDPAWLGIYINPDEIQKEVSQTGILNFDNYNIRIRKKIVLDFLDTSNQIIENNLRKEITKFSFQKNILSFNDISLNSYFISAIADLVHQELIKTNQSFSLETVMSHPQKIELLSSSLKNGFRTYLYYVATEDPEINISRVQTRVKEGGHDVPKDKIISRYYRSLDNLISAIGSTSRSFIFDNSGTQAIQIAEIVNGKELEIKNSNIPHWFQRYVLDKGVKAFS